MKRLYFTFLLLVFALGLGHAQTSNITFTVDMSNETIDAVLLSGAFTGWVDTAMVDNGNGTYSLSYDLNEGDTVEYKFKNGTDGWEDIPGSDCTTGGFGNNRTYIVPVDDATEAYCFGTCFPDCAATSADITFTVDMTNETIDPGGVLLSGAFTGWVDTAMVDNMDGTYSLTFNLNVGDSLEWKFKNGPDGWEDIPGSDCTTGGFGNNRLLVVPGGDATELYCFGSCSPTCPPTIVDVVFTVDMSNETIDAGGVLLSGAFTGWVDTAMVDNMDGTYSLTFTLGVGDSLEWKFKNGPDNWEDIPGTSCTTGGFGNNRLLVVSPMDITEAYCFGSCFACGQVGVTLHVDMSNETVNADGVFLAGSFNGWASDVPMNDNGDDTWSATVGVTAMDTIEYKFKNGSDFEGITDTDCTTGGFGNNRRLEVGNMDMEVGLVCFGSCSACPLPVAAVTFSVDMSNETLDPEGVRLAGTVTGWADTLMMDNGDGTWSISLDLSAGDTIEWKFKNGSGGWEDVSGPCTTGGFGNRRWIVPTDSTVLDTVCFKSCFACGLVNVTLTVDIQFETVDPAGVFLAGEHNGWTDGSMWDNGDGTWTGGFGAVPGDTLEYKFKNGPDGWEGFDGDCLIAGNGSNRFIASDIDTAAAIVCFNQCEECLILDTVEVTFRVDMTEQVVDPAGVFLAGSFNGFSNSPMMNMGDSIWALVVKLAPGDTATYKFKNGVDGWEAIAGTECTDGTFGNNRLLVAPPLHTVLDAVCFTKCSICFDPYAVNSANVSSSCINNDGSVTIVFDEMMNCDVVAGDLAGMSEIGFHSGVTLISTGDTWQNSVAWDDAATMNAVNDGNDVFSVTIDPATYYGVDVADIEKIDMVFNQGASNPGAPWDSEGKDADLDEDGSCDDIRLFLADLPSCTFDPTTVTSHSLTDAGSCYDPNNGLVKIRHDNNLTCPEEPGLLGDAEAGFHSGANMFSTTVDWDAPGAATAVNDGNDVFEVIIDVAAYYGLPFGDIDNIYIVMNQGATDPADPWSRSGRDTLDGGFGGPCSDLRLIINDLETCDLTNTIDRELENSLVAIPNPFDNKTIVSFSNPNHAVYNVTLLSLTSQQISTFQNINGTTLEIERNNMPSGMYFLNFRNEDGKIATLKLVVQ